MTSKPTSTLLIISLALNLIFIGLFAGMAIKRFNKPAPRSLPPGALNISKEDRAFTRSFFETAFENSKAARTARNDTQRAANEAVTSAPLDIERVAALLADLGQSEAELRNQLHQDLLESLSDMSQSQRAAVANQLFRRRGRPPGQRGRRGRPGRLEGPGPR